MLFLADLEINDVAADMMPHLLEIAAQLLATLLAFGCLAIFLWRPMRRIIKARQDYVKQHIADAEGLKAQAEVDRVAAENALQEALLEAEAIVQAAVLQAETERHEILQQTERERARRLVLADRQVESAMASARLELEEELVTLAVQGAEKLIGHSISASDNQNVIDALLKEWRHE